MFRSMADYKAAIDKARPSLNVAALIGHSALRHEVLADWRRPATEDEREQMQSLIREAMQAGAIGYVFGNVLPNSVCR